MYLLFIEKCDLYWYSVTTLWRKNWSSGGGGGGGGATKNKTKKTTVTNNTVL